MEPPKAVSQWSTVQEYAKSGDLPQIADPLTGIPVRSDLREAIALGMEHFVSLFGRDNDDEPYFFSNVKGDGTGEMLYSVNIGIPHVVGRSLLGLVYGEKSTGIPASVTGMATYERYLKKAFDDPDHLNSYVDPNRGGKRFIEFHNMREGLWGLVALMKYNDSKWARETAEQMLQTLASITDEHGNWSIELAKKRGMAERCEGIHPMNASRVIDPLMEYHRMTRSPLALKLAGLYARRALEAGYDSEGRFTRMDASTGHIHTITSSLSGIIDYALYTRNRAMIERCRKILKNGIPDYFSSWGWGDEVMPEHPANVVSRGEINQTGDVIRCAILLGESVDPNYYELAERYLRSMILPTQYHEDDLSFVKANDKPSGDCERDVAMRTIGGSSMQFPNDRMGAKSWPLSTLDITSGAVHAMSECYSHLLTADGNTCCLNMLFTCSNDDFEVTSKLPLNGEIEFISKSSKRLMIRIPEWVDRSTVRLVVAREIVPVRFDGAYCAIDGLKRGVQGKLNFAVPCKVEKETVDGTVYTTTWIGNQIVRILPRGEISPLPF